MNAHAFDLTRPLIVDSFAGGGGASTGIELALSRSPDIAINHNAAALSMHQANHPGTLHLSKNIWQVDPLEAVRGRPVGLAWFSPDCKHFSKAKGGKPVKRNIRDLAWTVVLWAKRARPAVIILENVEEFEDWGPLVEKGDGHFVPCPDRRGQTFRKWVGELKRLGYKVDWRELVAADYGAPTTRKRLFLIARRDGQPIVWPNPTHGRPSDPDVAAGRKLPWRTAAEIIDWTLPCPSIFDTSAEIMAKHGVRAIRPLAEATMARIARGTKRYVLDAAKPFIVKFRRGATGHAIDDPLCTVTANSYEVRPGGAAPIGLVAPHMVPITHRGDTRTYSVEEPARTITTANGGEVALVAPHLSTMRNADKPFNGADEPTHTITAGGAGLSLVAPTLVQTGYGEREGQAPRSLDIEAPLGTIVACGVKHAVAGAFLSRQFGASVGQPVDEPAPTSTEVNKTTVVAAFMAQHNTGEVGHPPTKPLSTIVGKGCTQGVVAAHLSQLYGSNQTASGGDLQDPAPTITTGGDRGGGHAALVAAFLTKYYGEGGVDQEAGDPLHTITTKARMGLVTVSIEGTEFVIDDIGMRMLTPRELFLAQGFPASYQIDGIRFEDPETGKTRTLSKAEQISCCGNSVCPPLAAALVAVNCAHLAVMPVLEAAE
ncbi:DNA cytosine methyltransferase [Antarcticirhabdus aurantiaca]|uniref:DNA cytosine methyltransferase n=1 Tax=Antarcticirhabdus aurantiaca TaxID=2606717 RepID=A0ACD4NL47_9HYPH|nr:DNA cytosine methyltransferase [Jeongeuplla avenae]